MMILTTAIGAPNANEKAGAVAIVYGFNDKGSTGEVESDDIFGVLSYLLKKKKMFFIIKVDVFSQRKCCYKERNKQERFFVKWNR